MPSTLSSAATKCISEVPGLVKQTFTPFATSVRTRLCAPFMDGTPHELILTKGYRVHTACGRPPTTVLGVPARVDYDARAHGALLRRSRHECLLWALDRRSTCGCERKRLVRK